MAPVNPFDESRASQERSLRILVDGYWWIEGPPSNRHVLRETFDEWMTRYPQDRLALMVPRRHEQQVRDETGGGVGVLTTPVWPHGVSNATVLAAAARRFRPDVVYTQNFAVPAGPALSVTFVHDVLFATNPEWFTSKERAYFSLMLPLARRADVVLTSSATEAARISGVVGGREVHPVGIGMSTELQSVRPMRPKILVEPGRFLLTVGRLNLRKNLSGVIAAALCSGVVTVDQPLVVVGAPDGRAEDLGGAAEQAIADGLVRFTGHVSDAELVWLYQNTALFVFLSRGEGYGMPPVEALFYGAPVVVSDIPVFREILPDGVVRVNPDDTESAAAAICRVVGTRGASTLDRVPAWADTVFRSREVVVRALARRSR